MFAVAYLYAKWHGYKTSASVFSKDDLYYLQDNFEVPFIKIANRPELYKLIKYVSEEIPIVVSIHNTYMIDILQAKYPERPLIFLMCISKYPQNYTEQMLLKTEYESWFGHNLDIGISDHTGTVELFKEYDPRWAEYHFVLEQGMGNDPYGTAFCITPDDLREIL